MLKRLSLIVFIMSCIAPHTMWASSINIEEKTHFLQEQINRSTHTDSILKYELELTYFTLVTGKIKEAGRLIQKIEQNYPKPDIYPKEQLALYHKTKGLYHLEQGDYNSAIDDYYKALNLYTHLYSDGSKKEIILLRNKIGRALITSNELQKAQKNYDELLTYIKTIPPSSIDSLELSNIYNNIGVMHYFKGELNQSLKAYDQSRTIAIRIKQDSSSIVGRALYNMGIIKEEQGLLTDARIFYLNALNIYNKVFGEKDRHIAEIYGAIGNLHLKRLELEKARYYFNKDLEISREIYGDNHLETTWGYENLGRVYKEEKKDSLAKEMFVKALKIRQSAFKQPHFDVSKTLLFLAYVENDPKEAIHLALRAYQMENAISDGDNASKWDILRLLIKKTTEIGDFINAEKYLKLAEKIGVQIAPNLKHASHAKTFLLGALLYKKKEMHGKSLEYIEKTINACLEDKTYWKIGQQIDPQKIHIIPEYLDGFILLAEMQLETALKDDNIKSLSQASTIFPQSMKALQIHQKRRTSDDFSMGYSNIYQRFYNAGLKTFAFLWQKTSNKKYIQLAFEYSERIKNHHSIELLNGLDAYKISNIPATTLRKEYKLKKDILYYQSLATNGTREQQLNASKELLKLFEAEEKFYNYLQKTHPNYHHIKFNFQPVHLAEVQKKLSSKKELAWHSTFVDDQEYLFLISKSDVNLYVLRDQKYNNILKPIVERNIQKIIVIPDFSAKWINLEAYKYEGEFLIQKMSFLYNTSLYNYFNSVNNSKLINKNILAFAPINFDAHNLSKLKHSEDEVKHIQKYFTTKSFIGPEATKEQFFKNLLAFGGLHLSTHISFDPINPLKSKIYFNPKDSSDEGIIYAHEIFGTPMRTHLVTLSACDTKTTQQEYKGIYSIADAFSYNGCENILMSLWEVDDKIMYEIVSQFYKYLSEGLSKEDAIRQSKIDYLQNADKYKSDEFYWSGIILQGDSQHLGLSPSFLSKYWIFVALILLVLAISILRWRI